MADTEELGYKRAGVDLEAADRTIDLITREVESTYTPAVLRGLGAFGGLFELPGGYSRPVLVASTDGVGTKVMLAARLAAAAPHSAAAAGVLATVGSDLVNHCINDILVQGAKPLFFLDYVASSRLVPETTAAIVSGVASACRDAGVALLGGETAEMPGVYREGEFDLAGTIVGVVERDEIVDGSGVNPGDVLLGLPSGGLQTNGFSLARALLGEDLGEDLGASLADGTPEGTTVGAALMAPHRSFLPQVTPLLAGGALKALAHITGGGLPGNLPRALPPGRGARLHRGSWQEPPIFALLQSRGAVSDAEMFDVFNMGLGFIAVVAPERVDEVVAEAPDLWLRVGEVSAEPGVRIA